MSRSRPRTDIASTKKTRSGRRSESTPTAVLQEPFAPALLRAVVERGAEGNGSSGPASHHGIDLDLMPAGVFGCDSEGRITFFNHRAAELWGRAPRLHCDEERFSACRAAYRSDGTRITAADSPIATALRTGAAVRDLQLRLERHDGKCFFASVHVDVLRDPAGAITGAVSVFHDVTERRRAELSLRCQNDALVRMTQGAPLVEILEALTVGFEGLAGRRSVATIWLLQPGGTRLTFAAGQGLSAAARAKWSTLEATARCSCVTAALRGERVILAGEGMEPRCECALQGEGFKAGFSTPILAANGRVLGFLGVHYHDAGEPQRADLELAEMIVGSAAVAIERCDRERAARENAARLQAIIEQAAVGVVEMTAEGRITLGNPRTCELLGYPQNELVQLALIEIVHPGDRANLRSALGRIKDGDGEATVDVRFRHRNGSTRWAVTSVSALRDATGEFQHYAAMLMDVTARKRAEHDARFLDRLSQSLAPLTNPDAIMHEGARLVATHLDVPRCSFPEWKEDLRHIVVRHGWYAPGAMDTTGTYDLARYGPDAWRQRALEGNLGVDDVELDPDAGAFLPAFRALKIRAYASARFFRGEQSVVSLTVTSDQVRAWTSDDLALLENSLARVWPLVERARAEARVRETAQRLTLAMRAGRLGDWTWDAATETVTLSGAPAEIIGVAPGTRLPRERLRAYLHPEDIEPTRQIVERALAQRADYEMKYRLRRPSGDYAWVEVHGVGVFNAEGAVTSVIGVMQEISDRKAAEEALRAREAELRLIGANVPAVLSHWDRENRLLFASRAFADRWNVPPESLYGKTVAEILGAPAFAALRPFIDRALAGESVAFEIEVPYEKLGMRFIQSSYAPEIGPDGTVRGYLAAVQDLTERRRAELALVQSEARLRLATRAGKIGLWDWDIAANTVTWTESLYDIHGVTRDGFDGTVEGFAALIHPEDRPPVERAIQSALAHDARYELEFRAVRPGGGTVWLFTNASVVREDGRPARMVGATVDITARKVAELALRESESRFRLLASHAPVGIFLTDAAGDYLFVNDTLRTMAGLAAEQLRGKGWRAALHPEDAERVTEEWNACIRERRPFTCEYRLLRPDRTVVWLHGSAVASRTAHGALNGHVGTVVDITERKVAENKLRAQEAQLRLISTNAPIMLAHCDAHERYLFVNRAYSTRLDLTPEDIIGRTIEEVIGRDARAAIAPYIARVLAGENVDFEIEIPYRDLGDRFMRGRYVPDIGGDGRIRGWLSAISDVTERRHMEDALRRSEEQLRQRTSSLETLNRLGTTLAAEHDIEKIAQSVIDAGCEAVGAAAGVFLYTDEGRAHHGRAPVAFSGDASIIAAPLTAARGTEISNAHFTAQPIVRSDDVRQDERYHEKTSPFQGREIRSYLAAAVVSRAGDRIGGLFFCHADPGKFGQEAARMVAGIAAQAAIAIDNANLYHALSRELIEKSAAEEELQNAQRQLRAHAIDLERIVEERTKSLREAIAQMEEFSYSVSHDLRAPLRAMNAYAEALLEDYGSKLDDTGKGYLERIRRSSQRMENLTHDVLTYSRVGRAEVDLVDINVEAMLRDVISQYADLQPPNADVTIERPLHRVRGHESSLGQCLANLLTNAAKFVAPGIRPRIRLWTEVREARVRIWVEDNGIGIPPEYQATLFQVFERVPTAHAYDGTGIGLAIVRKAAEKMAGRCGVESDGKSGSRFWIELARATP